ncbi:MAG: hypothetical protein RL632_1161 [Bacteroidota bacterium]|jgi:hypothetical protein
MFRLLISISIILSASNAGAQDTIMSYRESQLVELLAELRAAKDDIEKEEKNTLFLDYFRETLAEKSAYAYPFSQLKTVGIIDSPDGLVRIINWNIEQDDETQKYCGFVLKKDERKDEILVTELIDNSAELPLRPEDILTANNWYGALYYKIIPVEKGSKTVYTLLGWDGNSSSSNVKLIDVLYFTGTQLKLGSPIFKLKDQVLKRVFYEHSERAVMSLRYEEEYKRIIFDHLSPESPNLKGFYAYYIPDLSYDAFVLDGTKWLLKEDVIGVNPDDQEKMVVYVRNERTGRVEKKTIKKEWENPTDSKSEIPHVAITPEDQGTEGSDDKKEGDTKTLKKDKRDPNQMSTTLGGKKKRKRRN